MFANEISFQPLKIAEAPSSMQKIIKYFLIFHDFLSFIRSNNLINFVWHQNGKMHILIAQRVSSGLNSSIEITQIKKSALNVYVKWRTIPASDTAQFLQGKKHRYSYQLVSIDKEVSNIEHRFGGVDFEEIK
ncbi:hypothetical protein [Brevibacillus parabrevis]|uniref:hypothetical protein n=1 Tax=Brevibacillus parabrevis TaxID=54914 RepID=UPI0028D4C363|nr:hypothetical protein [Brevibacillus parabrevis]